MEQTSMETVVPDNRDETFAVGGEEFEVEEYNKMCQHLDENVSQYVQQNSNSTNTTLFSFLALLNAYIPESYLLKSECQKILGPTDRIHGDPPFEERMEPFTIFIDSSSEHVRLINQMFAQRAVELLADSGISRSATVKKLKPPLCGVQAKHVIQLLTKRELGENGKKKKFSKLIEDILFTEKFNEAVSVLKTASDQLDQNQFIPQTLSRLYYIRGNDYNNAEEWANTAIERAPNNSYVADTLGQVHKNRLMNEAENLDDILKMAKEAFEAFKHVDMKANKEEDQEMRDMAGTVNMSDIFNNRGRFGFIQVAKTAFEQLREIKSKASKKHKFIRDLKMDVEEKFDFFEWYLTYSRPDMTTLEPHFFWKDIAICYEHFTTRTAAESTSFPGLLDRLNRGLFISKGSRAEFEETEETVSDLEAIREALKTTYETNVDEVKAVEAYILSNIILSNKMDDSPQLTPLTELQTIIHRFLGTEVGHRSPEFYLLVLLLFWPEREPQMAQDEDEEEATEDGSEDDGPENETWEDEDGDEEQETRQELVQLSLDVVFDPDLQKQVTFMEKAYERVGYAKYLRGRYLLPLFFLGKGSGLSRWIHKARLDAIVEEKVSAELADEQDDGMEEKLSLINEMWVKGKVWQVPEIQEMLLPVQIEPCSPTMPREDENNKTKQKVFVYAGGKKIVATVGAETASVPSPVRFYLGFTIQGPVVFKVGRPHVSGQ